MSTPKQSTSLDADLNQLMADAEKAVRDGAYVAVGLGVLAFQRAQVRRREVAKRLEQERARLASQLGEHGDPLAEVNKRLVNAPAEVTRQLREVGKSLGGNLDATRAQLVDLARTVDQQVAPARRQLDQQVEALEQRLPAPARDVVRTVKAAMTVPEARFRTAVGLD